MNRFLCLLALLSMSACTVQDADVKHSNEYVFHDDYYYVFSSLSYTATKVHIIDSLDEYYFLFNSDFEEEVLESLYDHGFTKIIYIEDETFGAPSPEPLKNAKCAKVKGHGDIDQIPHVIFASQLSINEYGETCGFGNTLVVPIEPDNLQSYDAIMKHAEFLKVIPYSHPYQDPKKIYLACTKESRGNPAEIANWFYEVAGYQADCLWGLGEWYQ